MLTNTSLSCEFEKGGWFDTSTTFRFDSVGLLNFFEHDSFRNCSRLIVFVSPFHIRSHAGVGVHVL